MFDENDGFFDHMVPPTPPMTRAHGLSTVDTTHEIFAGDKKYVTGPYGLGVRVPMLVISPWSRGGWVNSQVFDHTSLIRFVERRFGVHEPNITPWRRAVTGDLTSAFDFKESSAATIQLPSTVTYRPPDGERHPDYKPAPPAEQRMPAQEPGTRPARALPYVLVVTAHADREKHKVSLTFRNAGAAGVVFHVRSEDGKSGPWSYTVGADDALSDSFAAAEDGSYALSVYGPNGFFRGFKGSLGQHDLEVEESYGFVQFSRATRPGVTLTLHNDGADARQFKIHDGYNMQPHSVTVPSNSKAEQQFALEKSFGWYDLAVECGPGFRRHFAGHVETGQDSTSDPAMAKA
jgi:phospholipase C